MSASTAAEGPRFAELGRSAGEPSKHCRATRHRTSRMPTTKRSQAITAVLSMSRPPPERAALLRRELGRSLMCAGHVTRLHSRLVGPGDPRLAAASSPLQLRAGDSCFGRRRARRGSATSWLRRPLPSSCFVGEQRLGPATARDADYSGTRAARSARRSVVGRVAVVEHEVIAVWVREEGHVADAGVQNVAGELDALGLELGTRGGDIVAT